MDQPKYLIVPSSADSRDYKYTIKNNSLRPEVDLRLWDSLVEDQQQLGSCVGNAVTNAYELMVKRLYPVAFTDLSRLFVYYNARDIENMLGQDEGVYEIRSALKGLKSHGVCKEQIWPYDISRVNEKPSIEAYQEAQHRSIVSYSAVSTLNEILDAINSNQPVVTGITIYSNFYLVDMNNSVLSLPKSSDQKIGGHAVTLLGYSLPLQQILAKNSFGQDWGQGGYFWLPFEYVREYTFEHWCFEIPQQ